MQVIPTSLKDGLIIEPRVFRDERGFFFESWNDSQFASLVDSAASFVQDNHSFSTKGVLRGLHYQYVNPQGKLVRVVTGEVIDVAVDLRTSSPTFGDHVSILLSEENGRQMWVPPGFAHGFVVLSAAADFLYKATDYYSPGDDYTIRWDDQDLTIDWKLEGLQPVVSEKDAQGMAFGEAPHFL